MVSNDNTFRSKNLRYVTALLLAVTAICFFYVILNLGGFFAGGTGEAELDFDWLGNIIGGGGGGAAPGILINIARGFGMILLGISVLFAVYLTAALLKGKDEDVPRFAKPYFMLDICVTSFCLIFYIIAAIITGVDDGNAMPAVAAVIGSALRAGTGVVIILTLKGIIPSKFISAIIVAGIGLLDFVLFLLTLILGDLGGNFNYELFGWVAFSAAFALFFFAQELVLRQSAEPAQKAEKPKAAKNENAGADAKPEQPAPKAAKTRATKNEDK